MKLLVFDISGKFAHFRKYYTNSSSTTYEVIPRTTLMGILAAMLGYPRDSYYDRLNSENLNITCKKMTETYKMFQTLNYIKGTSDTNLIKQKEHTQIPFQVLTGKDGVKYRIYVNIKDEKVMEELIYRVKNNKFEYSPTFGTANFNTRVDYVGEFIADKISNEEHIKLEVPVPEKYIKKLKLGGGITKEKMIKDFDKSRKAISVVDYIISKDTEFKIEDGVDIYRIKEINENIVFM